MRVQTINENRPQHRIEGGNLPTPPISLYEPRMPVMEFNSWYEDYATYAFLIKQDRNTEEYQLVHLHYFLGISAYLILDNMEAETNTVVQIVKYISKYYRPFRNTGLSRSDMWSRRQGASRLIRRRHKSSSSRLYIWSTKRRDIKIFIYHEPD